MFYFHTTTGQISQHPSPASPIHTNASPGNSLILNYIHCPKAQAWFPSNVHKTRDSQCCLVSLPFEFLYSSLARCQAQRKVLAFSQALLANRTSHRYVFFQKAQSSASRISPKNQPITLPKLSSLPKSDFLIFFTEQSTDRSSHFAHYYHSHSIFLVVLEPPFSHQTSVSFLLKPRENPPTLFYPAPTFAAITCFSSSIQFHASSLFPAGNFH